MALHIFAAIALSSFCADAGLEKRIAAVLPRSDEEKYLQIPWRLDLAAARLESQESKKPMFLWIMNGHPMGCT